MPWILLMLAGLLECGWAVGLKYSHGFSRFWPSVWTVVTMAGSFVLLALAMKRLPVGTAYAVWTGIGAIGTAFLGMLLFGESASTGRLFSLLLIVLGIGGLRWLTP
jgi:quaternary ammonium compound-resistance protein SugE